jgi:voltage-gated potassium channel
VDQPQTSQPTEKRNRGGVRRVVWAMLHTEMGRFTWGQGIVAILIVASFALLAIETEPTLPPAVTRAALEANRVIPWLFAVEFALRIWASGASPLYRGARGRARFFRRPLTWFDLLAFAPELIVQLLLPGAAQAAAWVRLLRLFRLLKLFAMFRAFREIAAAVRDSSGQLLATFGVAGMLLFVSATVLYAIEGDVQPDDFGSIPRALWWAVATLTTVGYGDVYPITTLGKFISGCVAVIGVGTVALPAGILASAFAERLRDRKRRVRRLGG